MNKQVLLLALIVLLFVYFLYLMWNKLKEEEQINEKTEKYQIEKPRQNTDHWLKNYANVSEKVAMNQNLLNRNRSVLGNINFIDNPTDPTILGGGLISGEKKDRNVIVGVRKANKLGLDVPPIGLNSKYFLYEQELGKKYGI